MKLKVALHNDSAVQSAEAHQPPAPWLLFFWPFFPATPRDIFTQQLRKRKKESCDFGPSGRCHEKWIINEQNSHTSYLLLIPLIGDESERKSRAVLHSCLQGTAGLMIWIFSVLEMHLSALLFNNEADKTWNSTGGKVLPFFDLKSFCCCNSVSTYKTVPC